MFGPQILVRTLSRPTRRDRQGNIWQYHSRSDHHSKVACWGIVFDLMRSCPLLRGQVESGEVAFGINHEMRDFAQDRKKNLDVVLCTPSKSGETLPGSLVAMVDDYEIQLETDERSALLALPPLRRAPVGSVLMALEAKACMTAHQRALPRLYDELNSSHQTVHATTDHAIAAGFVMINLAEDYLSPDLNKNPAITEKRWSRHNQPRDAQMAIDKVKQLRRRTKVGDTGYDALSIVMIECVNDGSPIRLVERSPAPPAGDIHNYASMIDRLSRLYASRFQNP